MPERLRPPPGEAHRSLADLCAEAVARHGSDWKAIERHVAERLGEMNAGDQSRLLQDIRRILDFTGPAAGGGLIN